MGLLNFEEQLTFYGQYHNNPWYSEAFQYLILSNLSRNRAVHILFVPMLFWSFMVFIAHVQMRLIFENFPFNWSFAITFLFIFYYLMLEPVAGVCSAIIVLLFLVNIFRPFLLHFCSHSHILPMYSPLRVDLLGKYRWLFNLLDGYARSRHMCLLKRDRPLSWKT